MFKVKRLKLKEVAAKIVAFLVSKDAFLQTWAPGETEIVRKAVFSSIKSKNHAFWYIEDKGKIIGAMGVRENDLKSGGYEMADDYLAVHKDYRRKGLGTLLLDEVEKFVKDRKGRYIVIESCDIESYKPASKFFISKGYKIVGAIPDFYVEGEGRLDYLKKF